jgi:hypothetical protein
MTISSISSFLASDYEVTNGVLSVINPGRFLISPASERERLRELGCPAIHLPPLVAVLRLMSDRPGPFAYRLSCFFTQPNGRSGSGMQMNDFEWPADQRFDRVTIRLETQIPFFERGGIYNVKFLVDGEPLCEIPLPVFWDDEMVRESTTAGSQEPLY